MAYEVTHGRHFVLRARENRKLHEPEGKESLLFDAVRALPAAGIRTIPVSASPGRKARAATVQIAFSPVPIAPPGKRSGDYDLRPLHPWAVRVWEADTPAGEEPLEWILLTNCPVTNLEEAIERID